MKGLGAGRPVVAAFFLAGALAASPSAAQDLSGLTFDVTVTTGDSAAGTTQAGKGWIVGKRSRLDLRGPGNPAHVMPGMPGENVSLIVHDSAGTPAVAMLDHDTRKIMYPSKLMQQLREMMGFVAGSAEHDSAGLQRHCRFAWRRRDDLRLRDEAVQAASRHLDGDRADG